MQTENHKEEVPFSHYEALFRQMDPEEALSRLPDVHWDGKGFTLKLLGRAFVIAWPAYEIRAVDGGAVPPLPTQTCPAVRPEVLSADMLLSARKVRESI